MPESFKPGSAASRPPRMPHMPGKASSRLFIVRQCWNPSAGNICHVPYQSGKKTGSFHIYRKIRPHRIKGWKIRYGIRQQRIHLRVASIKRSCFFVSEIIPKPFPLRRVMSLWRGTALWPSESHSGQLGMSLRGGTAGPPLGEARGIGKSHIDLPRHKAAGRSLLTDRASVPPQYDAGTSPSASPFPLSITPAVVGPNVMRGIAGSALGCLRSAGFRALTTPCPNFGKADTNLKTQVEMPIYTRGKACIDRMVFIGGGKHVRHPYLSRILSSFRPRGYFMSNQTLWHKKLHS